MNREPQRTHPLRLLCFCENKIRQIERGIRIQYDNVLLVALIDLDEIHTATGIAVNAGPCRGASG